MKRIFFGILVLIIVSCKERTKTIFTAQEIVDKSIKASGGELYTNNGASFVFRDKKYISQNVEGKKILKRISILDSVIIMDIKTNSAFQRFMNDSLVNLPDSISNRYSNSVNSVHYFARLPLGLNDKAVNKELLGEEIIKGKEYHKVKVTFDQAGGGDDFDDTYVYWFNKESFKPDYLAYDFHVNGGGQRFREAYNERYVNGIRFVDYKNYKPKKKGTGILEIGQLFENGELELLSKIKLSEIEVMEN
ncbi:DUF6503 family protein [Flagellimonas pacifica]|uniref:Deoxyribose-phosphate aldolase n=1 Tax=Flagellimonas pacifica TaxID=1247520 RepID=A0A285MU86_9FLAO|nr:DUF6503 family protein [Allomuricauda parva]SNZ00688.1 hypothetical protein SAMN06265377_2513 [Allomuricauda parva]